CCRVLFVTIIV
ncbi:unnamed protein product, partial [Rotaria magnacalcarata]